MPKGSLGILFSLIIRSSQLPAVLCYSLTGWKNGLYYSTAIDLPTDMQSLINKSLYNMISQLNVTEGTTFDHLRSVLLQYLGSRFPLGDLESRVNLQFFQSEIKYPTVAEIGGAEPLNDWTRFVGELRVSSPSVELGGWAELDRSVSVLSSDQIKELLNFRDRGEHTEVERHEFAMTQICKYFRSLDSEKRREIMITFASNLHECDKGKRFAVWQYYILLRNENQVADIRLVKEESKVNGVKEEDRADIESFLEELNDEGSQYSSFKQEVYAFIDRELSTESRMMKRLTNNNGLHGQLVHDKLFVFNSLYGQLGLDFEFDHNTGIINYELRKKTREEMAEIILDEVNLFVRETVSERINDAVNREGQSMYVKVSDLIGTSPENWNYNVDENEIPIDLTISEEALTQLLVRIGFLRE